MAVILQGAGVSKVFGGLMAVQDVDFEVQEGEIFGLIGPNGSGKTTLLNLVSGVFPPTRGRVTFRGQRIDALKPHQITRLGIGRAFQIVRTFEGLSVIENVLVGRLFGSRKGKDVRRGLREVEEILEFVKLSPKKDFRTSEVTIADRKRMELARALAMNPRLLLLDEVMAGLNSREVEDLMEMVLAVNRRGITILMIEHVMKAVMGISTRIMVLHHGKRIAMGLPKEIVENEEVIKSYLGERYARRKSC